MSFCEMLRRLGIPSEIAEAFDEVPREIFADPSENPSRVYLDVPIITYRRGNVYSTSSQPSLMADFMVWVGLKRGFKVLEIGGGTGYNAAVMSRIVGKEGLVVSLEYEPEVHARGSEILSTMNIENLRFLRGDGYRGYPELAPYDAIICTVGVDEAPTHWFNQLKDGGRIVVPLNLISRGFYQPAFLYERNGNWVKLEYKVATSFIKAGGMLGNLNERNLEKLDKIRKIPETDRLPEARDILDVLEVLTASLANENGRFYFVEKRGYAVWRRYFWEIHGAVERFIRVHSVLEKYGFPNLENRAFAHTLDRTDFEVIDRF